MKITNDLETKNLSYQLHYKTQKANILADSRNLNIDSVTHPWKDASLVMCSFPYRLTDAQISSNQGFAGQCSFILLILKKRKDRKVSYCLGKTWTNVFCKEPDGNYFTSCYPYCVCCSYLNFI